jgi:tol-pal system protein YbgF
MDPARMPRTRSTRFLGLAAAALALAACATVPPEEDPVMIRLESLDARLRRIEAVVQNQSLLELAQRLDALQTDIRGLRGSVEELQNEQRGLRKQQRDLYADLERRIVALESRGGAGGATGDAPVGSGGTSSADGEQGAYTRAFDALRAANYPAAIGGFRQFLEAHPGSDLADNAAYWLGEAYYVTRDYRNAASSFERVMREWPSSQKAPDALLKLGYTQIELQRPDAARVTLNDVIARYPDTEAARLARERLRRLAPGG